MAPEHLFSPLALGPVELANRIVSTAHQTTLVHDHLPTDDFVAYHEARARGGAGLIVLEATARASVGAAHRARRSAAICPRSSTGTGASPPPCSRTGRGSSSSCSTAAASRSPDRRARRPSLRRRSRARASAEPRALRASRDRGDRRGLRARLPSSPPRPGSTASRSRRAPLPRRAVPRPGAQPPRRRVARRRRFLAAVIDAVRAAAPGLCVGVRLSADSPRAPAIADCSPRPRASTTSRSRSATRRRTSARRDRAAAAGRRERDPSTAERFASALPRITTSRIVDRRGADRLIADGRADAVGMTRALIADPDLPAQGALGRLPRSSAASAATPASPTTTPARRSRCAINPRTGRELQLGPPARPEAAAPRRRRRRPGRARGGRRGGPRRDTRSSCSSAATTSAARSRSPGPRRWARASRARSSNNAVRQLDAAAVDCGSAQRGPRRARGRRLRRRDRRRPHSDARAFACTAWDVSRRRRCPSGTRVLVADWGGDPSGLDAAEVLAAAGKRVTLAVASVARRSRPPVPAEPLPAAALPRRGDDPPPPRARRPTGRLRNVFAPELGADVARTTSCSRSAACPRRPIAPAPRSGRGRARPATASRRGRSRRPCSRARSRRRSRRRVGSARP